MKISLCMLLFTLGCGLAAANSNFYSNPYLPYPPSCVQDMSTNLTVALAEQGLKFHESEIVLFDTQSRDEIPVWLTAYRSPCAEPDRSLIWIEFRLAENYAQGKVELELPYFVAEPRAHWRYGMNLATEPNGWGAGSHVEWERTYLTSEPQGPDGEWFTIEGERRWLFLLDNGAAYLSDVPSSGLSPSEYNAAFKLWLRFPPDDYLSIDVPAANDVLGQFAAPLPFSGRHSGLWVIEGASDQGFQLSISEQVGKRTDFAPGVPELPLVIFFSQYTFDSEARPMWLVGNVEFEPGNSEITIPIIRVSNGEFRGSQIADREIIGSVTLRSRSCNDLTFDYDYNAIGLGSGTARMQRLFSLEIAGYDCRDYDARVATIAD